MNIESRIKWSLILSLVMSYKNILNAFHGFGSWKHISDGTVGRVDGATFAFNYLIGFVICWVGMTVMHKVMIHMKFETIKRQIERGANQPRRRRADRPPAAQPEVTAGAPAPAAAPAPEPVSTP